MDKTTELRLQLNRETCAKYLSQIRQSADLVDKLIEVFDDNPFEEETNADYALYSGPFFSEHDKLLMTKIHRLKPDALVDKSFDFEDSRLDTLYFRYRARNYPQYLLDQEKQSWKSYCKTKLLEEDKLNYQEFYQKIDNLLQSTDLSEKQRDTLLALKQYGTNLINSLD